MDSGDPVEELLARCLEADPAERERTVLEAMGAHPELARELRRRLEVLEALGIDVAPERREFPERLGDYRLRERIGGGGMGVVFLAEQLSLKREVALKLIRPEHLFFEGARTRFRREAEAIAQLHHPGIVQIHGVGEDDGIPWFSMERVDGCTLAEVVRQLEGRAPESLSGADLHRALLAATADREPHATRAGAPAELFRSTWVEAVLRIALGVARALEHAHGRGVLHRDVKPSNVMLTPEGRTLLLDFGLTSTRGDERKGLTRTGKQVGTLHYMSPEQLRARGEVDERSDVYSLGATLYQLLTLQLPFDGEDELEVQRRVFAGDPDRIRARNRRVDSDVVTVCLTAMEASRERRYADMGALARDLENLLARRPIAARPPGPLLRVRRWAQRNPAVAVGLSLGTLLLVGLPSALLLQSRGHARKVERALDQATAAREQAEASFDFLAETFLSARPYETRGEVPDAVELLTAGARRIRAGFADQPRLRATLMERISSVLIELGRVDEALPLLEETLALADQLDPDDPDLRWRVLRNLAWAHMGQGHHDLAEPLAELCLELAPGTTAEVEDARLKAQNVLAVLYSSTGRREEAAALSEQLIEAYCARLAERHASDATHGPDAASTALWEKLVTNMLNLGQIEFSSPGSRAPGAPGPHGAPVPASRLRARDLFEEASGLAEAWLPEGHPLRADARLYLAYAQGATDQDELAEDNYRSALAAARRAFAHDSQRLGPFLNNLGRYLEVRGELDEAVALYTEAAAILRARGNLAGLAAVLTNTASIHTRRGEHDAAIALYEHALPLEVEMSGEDSPGHAFALRVFARALVAAERLERAGELYGRAGRILADHDLSLRAAESGLAAAAYELATGAPTAESSFQTALDYAVRELDLGDRRSAGMLEGLEGIYAGLGLGAHFERAAQALELER